MAKVITFSTTFPAYHPKRGQPTYFVEKIWKSAPIVNVSDMELYNFRKNYFKNHKETLPKYHTIRSGRRFKKGDIASLRIWSGKPYNSKQIEILPLVEIQNTWDIIIQPSIGRMLPGDYEYDIIINNKYYNSSSKTVNKLAQNDGLALSDFINWFLLSPDFKKKKTFTGQIICWNNNINY